VFVLCALAACGPARTAHRPARRPPPTPALAPTAVVVVSFVRVEPTPTAPSPEAACGQLIPVCWSEADKAKVAHVCYDEARGLLAVGMASCASTVARRQTQPDVFGSADLEHLLRFDQFTVDAALTRPWQRGISPPPEALEAVNLFLNGDITGGCWGYDSFRGRTPEQAFDWLTQAPEKHCILVRGEQAMIFFNWRDG
jgi:hypothetical protein